MVEVAYMVKWGARVEYLSICWWLRTSCWSANDNGVDNFGVEARIGAIVDYGIV